MNERAIEIKVGILVTACLALLVTFVLVLGDVSTADRLDLFVDVPTSADLKPGAPVKVAGVPAGKVEAVTYHGGEMDEALGRRVYVRVHLRVDADKLGSVREDAMYFITTQGVLGEKYVEIDPGSPERPAVKMGDVREGEPPLRLELMAYNANRLLASLANIIRDNEQALNDILSESQGAVKAFRSAAERVDGILAENQGKVSEIVDQLITAERKANEVLDGAKAAIGDGEALRRTIANIERISVEARSQFQPVVDDLRGAIARYTELADTGKATVDEARVAALALLADARVALGNVKAMTEQLNSRESSIGALIADKELYDDVREMVKDLKRHPWKFIWKE